jgi:hypothetical protein
MQTCSCKEPKWIKSYKHYAEHGELKEKCQRCVTLNKENPDLYCNKKCCGMVKEV